MRVSGWSVAACVTSLLAVELAQAQEPDLAKLREAVTLHASFDGSLNADFSRGSPASTVVQGGQDVPAQPNAEVELLPTGGRFGGALRFVRKSGYRPQYHGDGVLNYNAESWSASVSAWLRLDPDRDLEPGYCDPIQIIGENTDNGFIFLEWSKDHTPRRFRYAIRPIKSIWNPQNVGWEDIPIEKRPVIELQHVPFSREKWTHVVFTLENVNSATAPSQGQLFINGELQGTIRGWDLKFNWDPARVRLVLGAAYVGDLDDLAVFNRGLTAAEVGAIYRLPEGIKSLLEK
jgi:hypothetical protein